MKSFFLLLTSLALLSTAEAANVSVTLSISPQQSPQPTAPTITWNSTGAATCVASDGWSGTKTIAGSETLPQVTKTTKFTLTCSSPTGAVTVDWTAPTQWSDGTALTTISGWQIVLGPTATTMSSGPVIANAAARTAIVEAPAGTQFFAVRTRAKNNNGQDIDSVDSTPISFNVVPDKAVGAVTLTVDVRPLPPTNVTVH